MTEAAGTSGRTRGIVCLHIGTHKTGTKTIQSFLAANRQALMPAGVYVPLAGRHKIDEESLPLSDGRNFVRKFFTPGHHVVAWELRAGESSEALLAVAAEIAGAQAPVAVISSEELHPLYRRPRSLATIRDAFAAHGLATFVVVYFRRQDEYAESLYGEYVKAGFARRFEDYLETILRDGAYVPHDGAAPIEFEYSRLLAPFVAVFGSHSLIVRAYCSGAPPEALPVDFLHVLSALRGPLTLAGLNDPLPQANQSQTFRELLEGVRVALPAGPGASLDEFLAGNVPQGRRAELDVRFRLLTHSDAVAMMKRFRDDNALLERMSGCVVPLRDEGDVRPLGDPVWETAALHRTVLARAFAEWSAPPPA